MKLVKLSAEDLNEAATEETLQRAESYVGNFYDCNIHDNVISGKIRGNHGEYNVSLIIDGGKVKSHNCICERAKTECCKHAAALGLTYVYTPWLFNGKRIKKSDIHNLDSLEYYLSTTSLKELFTETKDNGITLADLSSVTKISVQQLSTIIKDEQSGKLHQLTEPIKLGCLYLLDKKLKR